MLFAKIDPKTKAVIEYPISEDALRLQLSNVSLPSILDGVSLIHLGYAGVANVRPPEPLTLHRVGLDMPVWQGDELVRTFKQVPLPAPLMPTLTRRQLRLALLSIGVTAETIESQIAAITDPQERAAALIEWQDANTYERDHPLITDIATALKIPSDQVDILWRWAAER